MPDLAAENSSWLSKSTTVGFIGAGRLGSSLSIAMARAGYRVAAVSSRRSSHREWLAEQLTGTTIFENQQEVADAASIVFITSSDHAIQQVSESLTWKLGQSIVHCSGAVSLDALGKAAASGALTGGIHPLQTFPVPDAFDSFNGITFGIESATPGLSAWLQSLAEELGGKPVTITGDQRPAYHAAAVMACGLLAGLTGLAAEVWEAGGGISRDDAVSSLAPLVKTTANSTRVNGLPKALTGPYVRGDVTTVRAHLDASSAVSAEHGAAYAAVALASLHLAKEQGTLNARVEAEIRQMLITALRASCEIIE